MNNEYERERDRDRDRETTDIKWMINKHHDRF